VLCGGSCFLAEYPTPPSIDAIDQANVHRPLDRRRKRAVISAQKQ
jgi:hypothetical protein